MSSRRSFLRSLSILPFAPKLLADVAIESTVPAITPAKVPEFYHFEKFDPKMAEFIKKYEKAIMSGDINTYGPGLAALNK